MVDETTEVITDEEITEDVIEDNSQSEQNVQQIQAFDADGSYTPQHRSQPDNGIRSHEQ